MTLPVSGIAEPFIDTNLNKPAFSGDGFESMVASLYQNVSHTHDGLADKINALSRAPETSSDPAKLIELQAATGEYTNYTNFVSIVARKSVNTVETLIKAQ